ncbi:MAG: ROK family protein [Anaerolineales bacterium]
MQLYGGIEAGGTKTICAVGTGPDDVLAESRFATTVSEETIPKLISFFKPYAPRLAALGIGSFGPLDLDPKSPTYGHITSTSKSDWIGADFLGPFQRSFDMPIGFDTDVNTAALGEHHWGAAQGLDTYLYLTIGTGIGGGAMVEGNLLHGMMHPEMGHIPLPQNTTQDPFKGICPYHGNCFEGLASGPALEARWGAPPETFSEEHSIWDLEATYIAYALVNYISILAPQRIILGGGVMQQRQLFPLIRTKVIEILNGYFQVPQITENIEWFIVPPDLDDRAGILGAIALARRTISN